MTNDFCAPLLNYIRQFVNLDENEEEIISKQSKEVSFPKGKIIFYEGEIARYAYFITSGTARSYYTDHTGKTITWMFHFNEAGSNIKNLFVVDYKSFLTQLPGTMSIEILSDARAIQITKNDLEYQTRNIPGFEHWMRKLNENSFIIIYERIFTLLTMTATDRYLKMLNDEPHLLQMFSNYYLASYLGILPQSLSRIRKSLCDCQ